MILGASVTVDHYLPLRTTSGSVGDSGVVVFPFWMLRIHFWNTILGRLPISRARPGSRAASDFMHLLFDGPPDFQRAELSLHRDPPRRIYSEALKIHTAEIG